MADSDCNNTSVINDRLILPVDDFFTPLDVAIEQLIPFLQPTAKVFRGNLDSAFTVATIPYVMAYSAAIQAL